MRFKGYTLDMFHECEWNFVLKNNIKQELWLMFLTQLETNMALVGGVNLLVTRTPSLSFSHRNCNKLMFLNKNLKKKIVPHVHQHERLW